MVSNKNIHKNPQITCGKDSHSFNHDTATNTTAWVLQVQRQKI